MVFAGYSGFLYQLPLTSRAQYTENSKKEKHIKNNLQKIDEKFPSPVVRYLFSGYGWCEEADDGGQYCGDCHLYGREIVGVDLRHEPRPGIWHPTAGRRVHEV